jgi:hypothetical protein
MVNPPSSHRPLGLKVSAILLVVFALLWIVTTIPFVTILAPYAYARIRNLHALIVVQCVTEFCVTTIAILMGFAALGLARNKNSGRLAAMLTGSLIAVTGVLLTLTLTAAELASNHYLLAPPVRIGIAFASIFFVLIATFGVWLLVYLNLPTAKTWFHGSTYYIPSTVTNPPQPIADAKADAVTHGYLPVSTRAPALDVSPRIARSLVCILAILSLAGSIVMLMYARSALPVTYLGLSLQGRAAVTFWSTYAFMAIAMAIGLICRVQFLYAMAIVLEAIGTVNRLLILIPSYRLRASTFYAAHYPAWHLFSPWSRMFRNAMGSTLFTLFLSLAAFFLWALWFDFSHIRQLKQPAAFDLPPIPEPEPPL